MFDIALYFSSNYLIHKYKLGCLPCCGNFSLIKKLYLYTHTHKITSKGKYVIKNDSINVYSSFNWLENYAKIIYIVITMSVIYMEVQCIWQ